MKNVETSSPWIAVGATIVGLVVGYSLVVVRQAPPVFANANRCPHAQTCTKGQCDTKADCADGQCDGRCPGCAGKNV